MPGSIKGGLFKFNLIFKLRIVVYYITIYLQNALLSGEQKQCNIMKEKGILDISRMSSIKALYSVSFP